MFHVKHRKGQGDIMKHEYITIDGVEFEKGNDIENIPNIAHKTIYDCYGKPSVVKASIYNEWEKWFIKNNGSCGVASYNCMMFTLNGTIYVDGICYYCYITKNHNRIYKVVE